MNQTAKDRAWKLFEIAFYAAFAWYLVTRWKSILDFAAGIAVQHLAFELLLVVLATLLFIAGKIWKTFRRHD